MRGKSGMRSYGQMMAALVCLCLAMPASAASDTQRAGTVLEAAKALKPGTFIWGPEIAPSGPVLLIVSLASQRATLYRNGIPIAISTISSGKDGHETPAGVFTVLQRRVEHHSNLYNNAPMPYMQRLTWSGVALHGGHLPGYPASHGCIRLPQQFARLLYGVTALGMTVIVTHDAAVPHIAPNAKMKLKGGALPVAGAVGETGEAGSPYSWTPEKSANGPVSIVISTRDRQVMVLRNGVVIGAGPVAIEGEMSGTSVFVLRGEAGPKKWVQVALPDKLRATPRPNCSGAVSGWTMISAQSLNRCCNREQVSSSQRIRSPKAGTGKTRC